MIVFDLAYLKDNTVYLSESMRRLIWHNKDLELIQKFPGYLTVVQDGYQVESSVCDALREVKRIRGLGVVREDFLTLEKSIEARMRFEATGEVTEFKANMFYSYYEAWAVIYDIAKENNFIN